VSAANRRDAAAGAPGDAERTAPCACSMSSRSSSTRSARGARLRELGATHVLDRAGATEEPGAPEAYDVILDLVAGPDLPAFLDRLAPNGRQVAIGLMGGPPPADFGLRLFADLLRSLSFATFSADTVAEADRRARTADLFGAAVRGEVEAVVHGVLALDRVAEAHARMDAGEVLGRLVLEP
jgi:NADPH:quinone reductase-like Zn-dependent oxidoreductase